MPSCKASPPKTLLTASLFFLANFTFRTTETNLNQASRHASNTRKLKKRDHPAGMHPLAAFGVTGNN